VNETNPEKLNQAFCAHLPKRPELAASSCLFLLLKYSAFFFFADSEILPIFPTLHWSFICNVSL